jgi:hypothetical protein
VFFNQQCNPSTFFSPPHQLNSAAPCMCVFSSFLSRPSLPATKGTYIFHLKLRLFQQLRLGNVIFSVCVGVILFFFFAFSEFHASSSACGRERHCVCVCAYPHLTHQINWVGNEFEFFIPRFLSRRFVRQMTEIELCCRDAAIRERISSPSVFLPWRSKF